MYFHDFVNSKYLESFFSISISVVALPSHIHPLPSDPHKCILLSSDWSVVGADWLIPSEGNCKHLSGEWAPVSVRVAFPTLVFIWPDEDLVVGWDYISAVSRSFVNVFTLWFFNHPPVPSTSKIISDNQIIYFCHRPEKVIYLYFLRFWIFKIRSSYFSYFLSSINYLKIGLV